MAILKLIPACKDYIWGGNKLRKNFGIKTHCNPFAEGWMLSTHKDGECIIENGEHSGLALSEYISNQGKTVLGTNCEKFNEFPILIKLIDANDNLSVQVHPSDDFAFAYEGQFGKTEAWYVLEAEPDAFIYYGFKTDITELEFEDRIKNNTLCDVLNKVNAKKGDLFFIPSGTIHAIGKGILVAEIQQNSNVTYRVYDYNRKDKNGNTRELHINKAVKVTNLLANKNDFDFGNHLVKCDYFTTDVVKGDFSAFCDEKSFVSILVVDGEGSLTCENESLKLKKGDSVLLTANSGRFSISGVEALITTI